MTVPETITKLIKQFDLLRSSYVIPKSDYNETRLRQDYLDPFFYELQWDVYNKQGLTELAREVALEQKIKIQGKTDFIDYSFKIGNTLIFIAEAKAPKVKLSDNNSAAYQVRRYAWNAKLPLSILTNFDEFFILDCTNKPSESDPIRNFAIKHFTYRELPECWDYLFSNFSKDAVKHGSFDRYVQKSKTERRYAAVDDEFLHEIENWRLQLARNIHKNNEVTLDELNYAVQTIIDRIIFLRICEDRGLENYETLKAVLNSENAYADLCNLFKNADTKYNSGIFHFDKEPEREEPDNLTLSLTIDNKVIKDIIKQLYAPISPYEFSVIPPAILGQVYEQFLGKVLTVSARRL